MQITFSINDDTDTDSVDTLPSVEAIAASIAPKPPRNHVLGALQRPSPEENREAEQKFLLPSRLLSKPLNCNYHESSGQESPLCATGNLIDSSPAFSPSTPTFTQFLEQALQKHAQVSFLFDKQLPERMRFQDTSCTPSRTTRSHCTIGSCLFDEDAATLASRTATSDIAIDEHRGNADQENAVKRRRSLSTSCNSELQLKRQRG